MVSSESRNAQNISDVVSTDIGAEEIRQNAITEALGRLIRNKESIPVFVDRAGREWSAEGYVSMCSRTELHNATIDAQRARAEETGHTVFQVSAHAGARPLCAPYQGRYYTWERGGSGVIHTIDGKAIPYDSVYNTSYGEPAGLFGINCGHRPMTKIDGFFYDNLNPLTEEELRENDRIYAESQRQRSLERRIRNAKTQAVVYDAAGDEQAFAKMAAQVKRAQEAYKNYCKEVGRTPRLERTQVSGYNRSVSGKATQSYRRQTTITIGRSIGAKALNYLVKLPNGEEVTFTEGTKITNIEVIAGKGRKRIIDILPLLIDKYGGSGSEWQKKKGTGYLDYYGESYKAEVHWYEGI